MTKYKVFLKSGSVLEIEAGLMTSNEVFVHFYDSAEGKKECVGSFPVEAIFGFYQSSLAKQSAEKIRPINFQG